MWPYLPKKCDCSEDPTNPGTVCNHTGLTASDIVYTGPDLTCTGIVNGMPVQAAVQQLDFYLCSVEIAQHFLTFIQTHSQEFPEFVTLINGAINCDTILACGPAAPTTTTTSTATPTTTTTSTTIKSCIEVTFDAGSNCPSFSYAVIEYTDCEGVYQTEQISTGELPTYCTLVGGVTPAFICGNGNIIYGSTCVTPPPTTTTTSSSTTTTSTSTSTTSTTTTAIPCNCFQVFANDGDHVSVTDCNGVTTEELFVGTPSTIPPIIGGNSKLYCAQLVTVVEPYFIRDFGLCGLDSYCNEITTTTTTTTSTPTTTTTTTVSYIPGALIIQNDTSGLSDYDVTDIYTEISPWAIDINIPVFSGFTETGFQGGTNGAINVSVLGGRGDACLTLIINGLYVESITIPGPGTYEFFPVLILGIDEVKIILTNGACP